MGESPSFPLTTCLDYPELTRFPRVTRSQEVPEACLLPWKGKEGNICPHLPDGWQQVSHARFADEEWCLLQLCFPAQTLASCSHLSLWPLAFVKKTLPRSWQRAGKEGEEGPSQHELSRINQELLLVPERIPRSVSLSRSVSHLFMSQWPLFYDHRHLQQLPEDHFDKNFPFYESSLINF